MLVELTMKGAVAIVRPRTGLVGGPETAEMEKAISGLIQEDNRQLIVDLTQVDALTTRGLAVLVSTHVNYEKRGGRLVLCNPGKGVRNVFRITRIGDVLTIKDSLAEALEVLNAS